MSFVHTKRLTRTEPGDLDALTVELCLHLSVPI
jgi:hypothetical protein